MVLAVNNWLSLLNMFAHDYFQQYTVFTFFNFRVKLVNGANLDTLETHEINNNAFPVKNFVMENQISVFGHMIIII